jgi:type IV secretory pathway VirB9-like protein
MRILTAVLLASVPLGPLCQPASADETPASTGIRVVAYSPLRRTEVVGLVGEPTTITFPKGESVYRIVQSGKTSADGTIQDAGWQGPSAADVKETPLGNVLPLWPSRPGDSTMSVITMSAEGVQRVYPFHLVAKPDSPGADEAPGIVLNLIFKGNGMSPSPSATTLLQASGLAKVTTASATVHSWKTGLAARKHQQAQAEERLRTDAFNTIPGGCGYHARGKKDVAIVPRCPMDNGQWTLMRFPGLSQKPAVYVVTGDDHERLARQHASGDFVVIEEIARRFRLRLGTDVLDIINDHFDPAGSPPDTGTISPTVQRDLIQAKQ